MNQASNGSRYNAWTNVNENFSTSDTFTFDSKDSDTILSSNPAVGTIPQRTCQPNGEAEKGIMEQVKAALGEA